VSGEEKKDRKGRSLRGLLTKLDHGACCLKRGEEVRKVQAFAGEGKKGGECNFARSG